jgi:hypothetical protein
MFCHTCEGVWLERADSSRSESQRAAISLFTRLLSTADRERASSFSKSITFVSSFPHSLPSFRAGRLRDIISGGPKLG